MTNTVFQNKSWGFTSTHQVDSSELNSEHWKRERVQRGFKWQLRKNAMFSLHPMFKFIQRETVHASDRTVGCASSGFRGEAQRASLRIDECWPVLARDPKQRPRHPGSSPLRFCTNCRPPPLGGVRELESAPPNLCYEGGLSLGREVEIVLKSVWVQRTHWKTLSDGKVSIALTTPNNKVHTWFKKLKDNWERHLASVPGLPLNRQQRLVQPGQKEF